MKKKKVILCGGAFLALAGLLAFVAWLDWRNGRVVLKAANYRLLTCDAENPEELTEQILAALVENSRFGGGLEELTEKHYQEAMAYFVEEAEYFSLSLSDYLERFYDSSEEEFRRLTKESARQTAKEEAVLDAIAKEEGIVLSDAAFKERLPAYMEDYGYTDEQKFLREHDEDALREAMRRDLVMEQIVAYLKQK